MLFAATTYIQPPPCILHKISIHKNHMPLRSDFCTRDSISQLLEMLPYTVSKKLTRYNLLPLFCEPWHIFDKKMTKVVNFMGWFLRPLAIKPWLFLTKTLVKFVILHIISFSEKVTKFATFLKFNWKEVMSLKKFFHGWCGVWTGVTRVFGP